MPNIVTTRNGTLVAIAQGKLHGSSDLGDTSILIRRSGTNGASWAAPTVVLSDPQNQTEFDATLTYDPISDALLLVYLARNISDVCAPCTNHVRLDGWLRRFVRYRAEPWQARRAAACATAS